MATITRASTALRRARSIVEAAWCKGYDACTIEGKGDRFCSRGAVFEASGFRWTKRYTSLSDLGKSLGQGIELEAFGGDYNLKAECLSWLAHAIRGHERYVDDSDDDVTVTHWNDVDSRTRRQVLAKFTIAITLAEKAEWRQRAASSRAKRKGES